jgi:hypothetical protein
MFKVNDDLSIYATRGDIVFFSVMAVDGDFTYEFQPGDIVRMAVYGRKNADNCVMQKDFPVIEATDNVFIHLEEEDTKIGESISKPTDYWYEVVLNPDIAPQTIIGYDEDGAKVFRLYPESEEINDYDPQPEDFPVVDSELDLTSHRPVENQAVTRAIIELSSKIGSGTGFSGDSVLYTEQKLTEEQKAQARANIGIPVIEPAEDDIPKVFFGGALPQTKDDTIMSFRYISKTEDIRGYCKTKAQGNSSMAYPKKNQTVKLYRDAGCTEKLKVNFKGWGKQSKFCFKANWIDLTHARNIVSARLWGDVVRSRANYDTIPEQLRTSPNQGAVDGFPVKVYANGVYQGRYTINIPKDAWMANMDDELDTHCILCGENYVSGCFRAEANIDGSDWTDEVHDTVPDAIKTRWNEVIRFVMNSTDDEFVAGIGNYFDVPSLIDYYLFGLASCGLDAFGKNQLYMTYDGQKWYATMYDMDSTWGLYFDGSYFVSDSYARNSYQDFADGDGNLLYIRLETLFADDIRARWEELKTSVLSEEHLINRFERFTDIAPPYLVAEDYASTTANGSFTAIPQTDNNNIQQLRDYIVKRWKYVDVRIAILDNKYAYRLTEPMVFDGTNFLNTRVIPFAEPKDFTVMVAFDSTNEQNYTDGNEPTLLTLDGYNDILISHGGISIWKMLANGQKQELETASDGSWGHKWERTKVIVAVFKQGVFTFGKYYLNHTEKIYNIPATAGNTFTARPTTYMFVGVRDPWSGVGYWKGTVNDLRVFNCALSEEEAIALINEVKP